MSDLAAGKKAAAVRAVNDYVKVGKIILNLPIWQELYNLSPSVLPNLLMYCII